MTKRKICLKHNFYLNGAFVLSEVSELLEAHCNFIQSLLDSCERRF